MHKRAAAALGGLAGVVLAVLPAGATVEVCREIDDDTRRLVCYDRANAGNRQPAVPADHPPVTLRVFSREVVHCGRSFDSRIVMAMACNKQATSLSFGTLCHSSTSGGKYREVSISLDGGSERHVAGRSRIDRRSRDLWVSARPQQQIREMLGKSRLVLRMTPSGEDPFTGTFNIAGLPESVGPLRRACGW